MVSKTNTPKKASVKILIVIIAIAIIGVGLFFAYKYTGWFGGDNSNTASNSSAPTKSPTFTPELSPTTTPEVKVQAPDLTAYGLTFNKETQKYESVDNKEAGYIMEEVYINGEKTQGLFVDRYRFKSISKDTLNKIPDGQEKYLISMPVCPLDSKPLTRVNIAIEKVPMFRNNRLLSIDCGGETVSVINILLQKQTVTLANYIYANGYIGINSEATSNKKTITLGHEIDFLHVLLKTNKEKLYDISRKALEFCDELGETSDKIFICVQSGMEGREPTEGNILKYQGLPVFMISGQ